MPLRDVFTRNDFVRLDTAINAIAARLRVLKLDAGGWKDVSDYDCALARWKDTCREMRLQMDTRSLINHCRLEVRMAYESWRCATCVDGGM